MAVSGGGGGWRCERSGTHRLGSIPDGQTRPLCLVREQQRADTLTPDRGKPARSPRGARASSAQQKRIDTAGTRSCSLHGVFGTHSHRGSQSAKNGSWDQSSRRSLIGVMVILPVSLQPVLAFAIESWSIQCPFFEVAYRRKFRFSNANSLLDSGLVDVEDTLPHTNTLVPCTPPK